MGNTSRDPIDHERTSRPRVGQTLKNPAKVPGLLFVAVGLAAFAVGLACLARQQVGTGVAAIVISVAATAIGGIWLAREARQARRLEQHDNAGQPDAAA